MKRVLPTLVFFGLVTMTTVPVPAADEAAGAAPAAEAVTVQAAAPAEAPAADQETANNREATDQSSGAGETAEDSGDLQPVPLTDADCVKCHFDIASDLDAHGEAHQEVGCTGCHEEHPPAGTDTIPSCSNCHDPGESDHFALQGCTSCHNPHHPLNITFTTVAETKPACLTCHPDKGEEMAAHPSAHADQDCNSCHNQHGLGQGQYQTCLDCHEGHSPDMTIDDCLKCHKPHSPTDITYGEDIPVDYCASCHEDISTTLAESGSKHSELSCVECHDGRHGKITPCVDCHDQPHDPYMHEKFPECVTCHRDPHNLAR